MSTYHDYFLAYKEGTKLYPLIPFSREGKWVPVMQRSGSYDTSLADDFSYCIEEEISDEMMKQIGTYCDSKKDLARNLRTLPFTQLPDGDFVRSGYFLIEDVQRYLKAPEERRSELVEYEIFFDSIDPVTYNGMVQNRLMFGAPAKEEDEEEYRKRDAADYMYFAFPDYTCAAYDAFVLRQAVGMFFDETCDKEIYVVRLTS